MFTKLGIELKQTAFTLTLKLKLKPNNNKFITYLSSFQFLVNNQRKSK